MAASANGQAKEARMRGEAFWMYGGDQRVSNESVGNRAEVERQMAAAKALFFLLVLRHD